MDNDAGRSARHPFSKPSAPPYTESPKSSSLHFPEVLAIRGCEMSSQLDPATLQFYKDWQTVTYSYVGLAVLLLYDAIISFPSEYKHIWQSSWSWVKVSYFCLRYVIIIQFALSLPLFFSYGLSKQFCERIFNVYDWLSPFQGIPLTIVMTLRTYALYRKERKARIFIIILVIIDIIAQLAGWVLVSLETHIMDIPEGPGFLSACNLRIGPQPTVIMGFNMGTLMVFDFIIFVMTLYKTRQLLRGSRTKLVWRLHCDCILYYSVLSVMTILTLMSYFIFPGERLILVYVPETTLRILLTTLVLRILLQLRQVANEIGVMEGTINLEDLDEMRFPALEQDDGYM